MLPILPVQILWIDMTTVIRITMVGVMLLIGAFVLFEWAQDAGSSLAAARTVAGNVIARRR